MTNDHVPMTHRNQAGRPSAWSLVIGHWSFCISALCLCVSVVSWPATASDEITPAQRAKDARIVGTLLRLPGVDLSDKPEAKAALLRHLETHRGTPKYLEIVEKFAFAETRPEL